MSYNLSDNPGWGQWHQSTVLRRGELCLTKWNSWAVLPKSGKCLGGRMHTHGERMK